MVASSRTGIWLGITGLVAVLLATTIWARVGVTAAQGTTPVAAPRTITVNGTGQASARPDEAIVTLGTRVEAPTAGEAQTQNTEKINAVIAAVKAAGLPTENIQTTNISLYPIQRNQPEPRPGSSSSTQDPGIQAYQAGASIRIKVSNVDQAGQIIDTAVTAGANQVQGIQFDLKDDSTPRGQALQAAVGDARKRADALAQAINVQITGVESIIESGSTISPPRPLAAPALAEAQAASAPQIEPGEQTVTAQVSITYSY